MVDSHWKQRGPGWSLEGSSGILPAPLTAHHAQVLVANIDYDDFKGKLGVGRIHSRSLKKGQTVVFGRPDAQFNGGKIAELFIFDNLGRTVSPDVYTGDLCLGGTGQSIRPSALTATLGLTYEVSSRDPLIDAVHEDQVQFMHKNVAVA